MKNKKEKARNMIIIGAVLIVFSICVIQLNGSAILPTSAQSEKTIGWGIKRANNNMQPDVGEANKEMLEENGGICLGNDLDKYIYLTFDEGYEAGYTESILNTLKENEVKATFFITSHYLNTASDLVERMINEGHGIGNHTPKYLMSGNYKII